MPNESLIAEIESLLQEVIALGGQNEQTSMLPNLVVQNANPAGLDGFVIITDPKDGDNILAKKVGSVIYADNDLVNVLFVDGGEAIAFQQGSESNNAGIWEIIPSTSTDIKYDKGSVVINGDDATFTEESGLVRSNLFITRENVSSRRSLVLSSSSDTDTRSAPFAFLRSSVAGGAVQDTWRIGDIFGEGDDGTDYVRSGRIGFVVSGAVAADTVPMAFVIDTSETDLNGLTQRVRVAPNGDVLIGTGTTISGQLHIDQPSATGAQPVLYMDQADVSEEMFQFETTIGTGNAIEASALKVLTTTHFVKTTLPGGLTRYFPVGTISNTLGPLVYKSQTVSTQGLGAGPDVFAFGFYEWSTTDANLTQASTTQTFGTANVSYAAHPFVVTGGAGSVDTGVVGLRVNGTSINDQGTRTPADTETIIADITAVAVDEYYEAKKFLGQVTFELFVVSGSPTTYSLDFNYGYAKYDDWGNNDFTITDIECVGYAGANDSNFDIELLHHRSTGWTYSAAAFTPITAANTIAALSTDHSTDDQLANGEHAAWKRDNLSAAIDGEDGEGFLVFVSTTGTNAVEYFNIHIGVVF